MQIQEKSKTGLSQTAPLPTKGETAFTADPIVMTSHSLARVSVDAESRQIGDIVGNRYVLQTRVGPGRLGIVYEATDQQLMQASRSDYRVTIELFCLPSEQAHLRTRFASEFVDLLSVSHPNIARIIDFGIDGDTIFFTTELLEGTSLDAMLDGESTDSFSEKEILAVLSNVADALQYAHTKGVIHGGLSSASIFITTDYEVKISDLAIEVLKRTLGNPDDQLAASSQQALKPTADVFGIAAVAYELLVNEAPYEGLPRGHARKRGLRLRRAKGIPRFRWKALSRALQLRPLERTPTVARFVADFGISGTESLQAVAAGGQPTERRSLVPAILLVAIASVAALIQFDVVNPSDILSQLRERMNASAPPVVTIANVAEETAASDGVGAVADDVTGIRISEMQPQQLPEPPPETAATEIDVADDLLSGPVLSAEGNSQTENLAPVEEAQQAQETATTVTESSADVDESVEFVADSPIDAPLPAPPTVSFARDAIMVREGQDMAAVVLQRLGNTEAETPVFWWTGDNTAIADLDYADLGVRSETFGTGVESISLYVPLISDSLAEQRESFYVFVASDLEPGTVSDRIEVIVNDDDR